MGRFSGMQFGIAKPLPALKIEVENPTNLSLRPGEDAGKFNEHLGFINYLMESFKFLPQFEQETYQYGRMYKYTPAGQEACYEFGDAFANPYEYDGEEDMPGSGRNYNPYSFGSHHRITLNGEFWGEGSGEPGKGNVDFSPAAGSFAHIKNKDIGDEGAVDLEEYLELLFGEEDHNNRDKYEDYSAYFGNAKDTVSGLFGDQSYYQVVMSGFKDPDTTVVVEDEDDGGQSIRFGNADGFLYDGLSGEQAFQFMLTMLESRRRVIAGMSEVFGPTYYLRTEDGPDDQAMINNFANYTAGLDPHNVSILEMFFASHHSWKHAMIGMLMADADEQHPIHMPSGRDRIAYQRFKDWINGTVEDYIADIDDRDEQAKAENLFWEYKNAMAGYYFDSNSGDWPGYRDYDNNPGWDYYWRRYKNNEDDPVNINPEYINDGAHRIYSFNQIRNLNHSQRRGYEPAEGLNGQSLYANNWVVNIYGKTLCARDRDVARYTSAIALNTSESFRGRRQMKRYQEKVEQAEQDEFEAKLEDNKAHARRRSDQKKLEKAGEKRRKETRVMINSMAKKNREQKIAAQKTTNNRKNSRKK